MSNKSFVTPPPQKYYGTSSAEYGEVDTQGNITSTSEEIANRKKKTLIPQYQIRNRQKQKQIQSPKEPTVTYMDMNNKTAYGITPPKQYYGTSSLEYGEIDQQGNVRKTPKQFSTPLKSKPQKIYQNDNRMSSREPEVFKLPQQDVFGKPSKKFYGTSSKDYGEVDLKGNYIGQNIITQPNDYIQNKILEINEYNNKYDSYNSKPFNNRDKIELKELERSREAILSDFDTREGVIKAKDSGIYIVPVENYNPSYDNIKVKTEEGRDIEIKFVPKKDIEALSRKAPDDESWGGLKGLANMFTFGQYQRREGKKDKLEILKEAKEQTEDIIGIKPTDKKDSKFDIFSNTKPELYSVAGETKTAIASEKDLEIAQKEMEEYKKTPEYKMKQLEEDLSKKVGLFEQEKTLYDVKAAQAESKIKEAESTEDYKTFVKSEKEYKELADKYKDRWGTSSDIGIFDKEGNVLSVGPGMSSIDQQKFIELSSNIQKSYEKINPKIQEIGGDITELKREGYKLQEKGERLQEISTEVGKSMTNIDLKDPIYQWKYTWDEREKAGTGGTWGRVGDTAASFGLGFAKTAGKNPIEFLATSPYAAYKIDQEQGRSKLSMLNPSYGTELLARGIYDPKADVMKFNPDAAEGALAVTTFAVPASVAYKSTINQGLTQGTKEVAKLTLKQQAGKYAIGGAIAASPIAMEAVNYYKTPEEERSFWKSTRNVGEMYGGLAAYGGLAYAGSKTGANIAKNQITKEINKQLASGKFIFQETPKGVQRNLPKDVLESRGISGQTDLTRTGMGTIDTKYGKIEVRFKGDTTNVASKDFKIGSKGTDTNLMKGKTKGRYDYRILDRNNNPMSDWKFGGALDDSIEKSIINKKQGIYTSRQTEKVLKNKLMSEYGLSEKGAQEIIQSNPDILKKIDMGAKSIRSSGYGVVTDSQGKSKLIVSGRRQTIVSRKILPNERGTSMLSEKEYTRLISEGKGSQIQKYLDSGDIKIIKDQGKLFYQFSDDAVQGVNVVGKRPNKYILAEGELFGIEAQNINTRAAKALTSNIDDVSMNFKNLRIGEVDDVIKSYRKVGSVRDYSGSNIQSIAEKEKSNLIKSNVKEWSGGERFEGVSTISEVKTTNTIKELANTRKQLNINLIDDIDNMQSYLKSGGDPRYTIKTGDKLGPIYRRDLSGNIETPFMKSTNTGKGVFSVDDAGEVVFKPTQVKPSRSVTGPMGKRAQARLSLQFADDVAQVEPITISSSKTTSEQGQVINLMQSPSTHNTEPLEMTKTVSTVDSGLTYAGARAISVTPGSIQAPANILMGGPTTSLLFEGQDEQAQSVLNEVIVDSPSEISKLSDTPQLISVPELENVKEDTDTDKTEDIKPIQPKLTDDPVITEENVVTGTVTGIDTIKNVDKANAIDYGLIDASGSPIVNMTGTTTPSVPGITTVPPVIQTPVGSWLWAPKLPRRFGNMQRSRTFRPIAFLNPLADWRIYFQRKFGYMGMPNKERTVNIYKTKFSDKYDIDPIKKIESLLK